MTVIKNLGRHTARVALRVGITTGNGVFAESNNLWRGLSRKSSSPRVKKNSRQRPKLSVKKFVAREKKLSAKKSSLRVFFLLSAKIF
jgi:hypothetical protein